jgi:hypothetical protein
MIVPLSICKVLSKPQNKSKCFNGKIIDSIRRIEGGRGLRAND